MSYLDEFRTQIVNGDLHGVLQLWEEYCSDDTPDAKEMIAILDIMHESDLSQGFGEYVELILPLWREITDPEQSYGVIRRVLDIQTTNSAQLAETAYEVLEKRYGKQERFDLKMRLVGMRTKQEFQGAITNYELLSHLDKGKFVYHIGGWGVGEVMDYSLVREELSVEFENVVGRKELSFTNAFKYLKPLPDDHFLSRRFGDPDALEVEAKEHPVRIISILLRDLGPLTAAEIKEEMLELVIRADDWTKWWQNARTRLKKDTRIEMPASMKDPFRLRDAALSHDEQLKKKLQAAKAPRKIIQTIYNFTRDFPEILKTNDTCQFIEEQLKELESQEDLPLEHRFQVYLLQEGLLGSEEAAQHLAGQIKAEQDPVGLVQSVEIVAFKKRVLMLIEEYRSDYQEIFGELLFSLPQATLKDYLLNQLVTSTEGRKHLESSLHNLVDNPVAHPNTFLWYFQKLLSGGDLPYSDQDGVWQFFESLLILFSAVENQADQRDIVKKIYGILTAKRFAVVRSMLEGTSIEYAREFILLISKIQSLSDHDKKIMLSLTEVVHPSLKEGKIEQEEEPIWTTAEGFNKLKEQIHHIGTVETVENAKEIEAARALGDLRENSEYKFALERRDRLQAQLKLFTEQLNRARILTPEDITTEQIGVGVTAELEATDGAATAYTLLGPWDADPDAHILSFQSKLARAMCGHKVGDSFDFQGTTYTVKAINSALS